MPRQSKLKSSSDRYAEITLQIAKRVRRERSQRDLTQAQLAKKIGVPQTVISYIESERANPTLQNLVRLAEFFEIPLRDFFTSTCNPHAPRAGTNP